MTQSSVDDPVEIIRLHHMEPLKLPRSFRVDAAYTQLDAEGVDRLITLAIERFEEDDEDTGEAIVSCLSTFTDAPLDRLLTVLLAEHVTPPIAFRRADDRYAVAIIDSLHENPEAREWALPCLAWIGSDRVAAFLAETPKPVSPSGQKGSYAEPRPVASRIGPAGSPRTADAAICILNRALRYPQRRTAPHPSPGMQQASASGMTRREIASDAADR